MYDELVKRLREDAEWAEANEWETPITLSDNLKQAADAIEELQKVGNTLLAKYEEDATTVIWEYSGNIDESLDRLRKEIGKYKAQINGVEG